MEKIKYCQDCGYPNPDNLAHCLKCKNELSKTKEFEHEASWKYYVVNEDGSMSAAYTFSELRRMKNNGLIHANTHILKVGEEEPKIAETLFDFDNKNILSNTNATDNIDNCQCENIPEEIKGLNWGAFFNPLLWSIFHNTYVGLLCLFPALGLLMSIIFLVNGNEWGWKNRQFDSIEQFKKVQHIWLIWGLILFIIGIPLYIWYLSHKR